MQTTIQETTTRMLKSIDTLKTALLKIRTGRASPGLLDHVKASFYGTDTPLNQVANITVENARTLLITPWDKSSIPAIEKAIMTADLGLNPTTAGTVIRVPMPALNEERRRELVKVVRDEAEGGRVSIRNIRRDANQSLKDLLREKALNEDEERRGQTEIQKLTDKYIAEIDKLLAAKETELMEV
jgi:ribosome recycling factor